MLGALDIPKVMCPGKKFYCWTVREWYGLEMMQ